MEYFTHFLSILGFTLAGEALQWLIPAAVLLG